MNKFSRRGGSKVYKYLKNEWRRSMKKIILFCLTLMIGIFSSGCSIFPRGEEIATLTSLELTKPENKQYIVKKGSICRNEVVDGFFVPINEYKLSFSARAGVLKELKVKEGDYVKKGQMLAELDGENLNNEIKMQQINFEKAKLRYASLVEEKANEKELKIAEIEVEEEKLQLEDLQNEYSKLTLVSNVEGIVVYCPRTNIGERAEIKSTIIKVADVGKMQIECTGDKITNFKVGMKVNIKYKEKDYTGTIASLGGEKASTDGNNATVTQYTSMRIDIDKQSDGADLGKSVVVTAEIGKKDNVIIIPKRLVKISGDKATVQVLENNKKTEKELELGLDNYIEVEVIKGLKEGDIVLE